jgi:ribonuclease G
LENNIRILSQEMHQKSFTMVVHAIIEAYLTKGWFWKTILRQWEKKYGVKIKLDSSTSSELLESHYFNEQGEELHLKG